MTAICHGALNKSAASLESQHRCYKKLSMTSAARLPYEAAQITSPAVGEACAVTSMMSHAPEDVISACMQDVMGGFQRRSQQQHITPARECRLLLGLHTTI